MREENEYSRDSPPGWRGRTKIHWMPLLCRLSDARCQAQLECLDLYEMPKPEIGLGLQEAQIRFAILRAAVRDLSRIQKKVRTGHASFWSLKLETIHSSTEPKSKTSGNLKKKGQTNRFVRKVGQVRYYLQGSRLLYYSYHWHPYARVTKKWRRVSLQPFSIT